jgi:hypothetical protein
MKLAPVAAHTRIFPLTHHTASTVNHLSNRRRAKIGETTTSQPAREMPLGRGEIAMARIPTAGLGKFHRTSVASMSIERVSVRVNAGGAGGEVVR